MKRSELQRNLEVTSKHLVAARMMLPDNAPEGADGATLAGFQECLEQNELELALYELEDLGLTCNPAAEFWRHLMFAAENMGLGDSAADFKQRMQGT